MKTQKRILSLLLCICMMLFVAVSSASIILHAEHDCAGDHCEVCEYIAEIRGMLKSITLFGALAVLLAAAEEVCQFIQLSDRSVMCLRRTLVGWKIRLND